MGQAAVVMMAMMAVAFRPGLRQRSAMAGVRELRAVGRGIRVHVRGNAGRDNPGQQHRGAEQIYE